MKNFILISILILSKSVIAQQNDTTTINRFIVNSKITQDRVILRWQPSNEIFWKMANKVGYNVERIKIAKDTSEKVEKKKWFIKPMTEVEWHNKMPNDTIGATLATLAYGNTIELNHNASLNELLQKKYENQNRFFLAMYLASYNPKQAFLMGLGLEDKEIIPGQQYVYRIYSETKSLKYPSDTTFIYINTNNISITPILSNIESFEGDHIIRLKINKKIVSKHFIGFYFEKSNDGEKFVRLNNRPFLQISEKDNIDYIEYTDSLDTNYKPYFYRIIGITGFGEEIENKGLIVLKGRDLKAPTSIVSFKGNNVKTLVHLSWIPNVDSDMLGYIISRSFKSDGPFSPIHKKIISKINSVYTDSLSFYSSGLYYTITAIDTAGNASISLPIFVEIKDETPPATPTGLKGQIDSTGIVKITWNKNQEPDLLGYMVYTANAPDHVFTPLTTGFLADEFFADSTTLRTLTKYKYYRVVAFDKSRHASPYSEILKLKRPDKNPPVAPVMANFSVADSSAKISWIPSSSEDVIKQLLYRKEEGKEADWKEIKQFDSKQTSYTDTKLTPKHWYSYVLVAVDESNLKSAYSFPIRVRPYDSGLRKGIEMLKIEQIDSKNIKVSWQFTADPKARILIYRKKDNGTLVITENLPSSQNSFSDKITSSGKYQYAIKVIYDDGGKSILNYSDGIQIIF